MITKHTAIYRLYSNVTSIIEDSEGNFKPTDKDGKAVAIDIAAVNAEFAKLEYKNKRCAEYPPVVDQLDYIYHNSVAKWKTDIVDPVKNKYPKP
jgi:hypothetical protein